MFAEDECACTHTQKRDPPPQFSPGLPSPAIVAKSNNEPGRRSESPSHLPNRRDLAGLDLKRPLSYFLGISLAGSGENEKLLALARSGEEETITQASRREGKIKREQEGRKFAGFFPPSSSELD